MGGGGGVVSSVQFRTPTPAALQRGVGGGQKSFYQVGGVGVISKSLHSWAFLNAHQCGTIEAQAGQVSKPILTRERSIQEQVIGVEQCPFLWSHFWSMRKSPEHLLDISHLVAKARPASEPMKVTKFVCLKVLHNSC